MSSNFTNLKTKNMTKADIIEVLDKYDSDFTLETGEVIQAIYFYDFGKLADGLKKKIMNEKDKIRLKIYEEILDQCKAMYSECILDYIREQISILKHGI